FRAEYAETLALTTATVTVDDTKAVLDAKEALDGLTNVVKAQLNKEVIHLTRLYNKILELKTLDTVYLSATGDDANDGTQNSPVATLDKAYQWVRDGGTISIVGTYTLASDFVWNNHGKIVTISGGTLNGAALSKGLVLGEDVTFENITLEFDANDYIYANGHKLVMGENVVITNAINLFGGGVSGTTVESTDLTVLSGSYVAIYGGSNSGDVTGDTNLYIGGNVNSAICTALNHENVSNFYGGGYGGTVGGSTNIVFTDNALSSFVVGGGSGSNVVEGDTNVEFSGNASSYGIYGGTNDGSTVNGDINIVMKGGSVADLFGASGGTSYTGNVNIQLLGGNVVRRVYGGCYNGVGRSGLSIAWDSSYYVNGNITLFLSSNANVSMDGIDSQTGSKYDDRSLYVRSRQYTLSSNEKTYLIYADKAAYDKYKDKTGPQDDTMTRIMKNSIFGGFGTVRSASDNVYYCTYSANGSVITQKFNNVSVTENRADGTLEVLFDSDVSSLYTGSPIEAAKIVKNSTWVGPIPEIVYSNNTAVGTATASITSNGSTASTTFQITEDLTPAILGASISKSESQDIRFSCQFALTDKKVKEYGILITYYNRITKGYVTLEDLTVDSDNAYVIKGIATLETPASKSGQMFYANIGQVPPTSYGYRYVARIFVKYEGDDTYYYSDGGNGSIESATGVENGYICRSVISIAKSILSWTYDNYEKMDDEYGVGEITEIISGKNDNGKYVWASGVTANNGEKVLAYLNENAEALSRAISAIKQ
ncbi:MAG: hypothetical protein J6J39_04615, partial [Clostridia bacterium]|nr:hypothetical protein [Clostridia bacterium]